MGNLSGLIDLKSIVQGLIYKLDLEQESWTKFYQYSIDGMRELTLFHLNIEKSVKLEMSADLNTVTLPDDFVEFIDLAIPLNGRLWSLTQMRDMNHMTTLESGAETQDADANEGVYNFLLDKSAGGRNARYYKIDLPNNRIMISGLPQATVVLRYLSNGVSGDANIVTYVPTIAKSALESFIRYQYMLNNLNAPLNRIQMFEKNWRDERGKLRRLTKIERFQQFADNIRQNYYNSTKG